MFTLLTPSALLALLGLLVPVAIHLWNRRPGREVAVGSLRWLAAGANRRLRNLKIEQLWLLLLRAALLAVLAGAAAGPVWRQVLPAAHGQVLLGPELRGAAALATLRPTIDSLRRRGYGLRWLAAGFPKVLGAEWRTDSLGPPDSIPAKPEPGLGVAEFRWARLQQAASVFAGQPLYVVSTATLRNFQGPHPPLAANLTWQTLPTATTDAWVQSAALRGDSLRLLVGQSGEHRTKFYLRSLPRPRPGGAVQIPGVPPLRFETQAEGSQLRPLATAARGLRTQPVVPVRTKPVRVVVYVGAGYALDARCLRAGIQAAAVGLPAPLAVSLASGVPNPGAPLDWLFWLSDEPLPAGWRTAVRRGTNVWQEAAGPGTASAAQVVVPPGAFPEQVFRRAAPVADSATNEPVWTDGFGRAVLTRQALGQGAVFRLRTRLNPAWSNMADSPLLPARLLELLRPETPDGLAADSLLTAHDQRALDPAQLQPPANPAPALNNPAEKAYPAPIAFRFTDLRPWLVLVAGVLFAIERLLAHRRDTQTLPAAP